MDPKQLFLSVKNSRLSPLAPPVKLQYVQELQQWYVHEPSKPPYSIDCDREYQKIRQCFEQRERNPNQFFRCSCGYCLGFMQTKAWQWMSANIAQKSEAVSLTPTPSVETTQSSEALSATSTPSPAIPENPTPPPSSPLLTFGKYRGRTYEHVWKGDKAYCIWCIKKSVTSDNNSTDFLNFVAYVEKAIHGL
jgi:hypothetical protein